MPSNPERKNRAHELDEDQESSSLNRVLGQNRMSQVRQEIGIIADRSFRMNLISEEVYEGYREVAEGREGDELSSDMLESTRKFAKEHEEKAVRIHERIAVAIRAGIASEADEEFLMEQLIVENTDFVAKANEVEGLINAKLTRMQKDRETYDKFAAHPLIKEAGCLQLDDDTAIEFPELKDFLELSVPERRELLRQLEEALPKAEKYAKECEEKEDEELIAEYEEKLDDAVEQGIIGRHTHDEFLNEFKEINSKKKIYWNTDTVFEGQMKRYENLWSEIRGTLQGEALDRIEGKIDQCGYKELDKEFGLLKQSETQRLHTNYAAALAKYEQDGVIGRHTVGEFMMWMYRQNMDDKYSAEDQLPEQMARYEELWEDVNELDEDQQDYLKSKIHIWGYTELRNEYLKFRGEAPANDNGVSSKALSQIRSTEMKEAIVETDEMLSEQGAEKKKSFIKTLGKMFREVSADSFDATSFEEEVHKRALKTFPPPAPRDVKGRAADDEVEFMEIEKDTSVLEEAGSAEIKEDVGFVQVESKNQAGEASREVQLTINEEDGLGAFFDEQGKRDYIKGKDDISLAIYTQTGRTVEMDKQEVDALRNYLKESEEREQRKAA